MSRYHPQAAKPQWAAYPGDLRDDEWELIAALLPPGCTGGRPRGTDLREVMNAILYLATGGCHWRMPLKNFSPLLTVLKRPGFPGGSYL